MYLPASDNDVPAIVRLMNRAYRGADSAPGWSTEQGHLAGDRITDALLRSDVQAKPTAWLLKWQDDLLTSIKGCVWLEPLSDELWYLGSLAVDPDQQSGGLGRAMLAAAEDWARERGAKRVRMSVINVRKAIISWYLRGGYVDTGETEPFPYGDNRFGVPLRDDLCFVILEKTI